MKSFLKKVSLYALGGLVMATTFTACINNDEPAGVQELRTALADLLKSKVGLASANSAYLEALAQHELALAEAARVQAEIEKLLAQADAAIKQAQAAGLQAEADKIKAETEAYIAEQQANLEKLIAQNEEAIVKAQIEAERAQKQWLLDQADLSKQLTAKLDPYYTAYFTALGEYQKAYTAYVNALKGQLQQNVDNYDAVTAAQEKIDKANETIAEDQAKLEVLNEALTNAEALEPADLLQESKTYTEMKNDLLAQQGELNVQLAELKVTNFDLYQNYDKLNTALTNAKAANVKIKAWNFKATADMVTAGIPASKSFAEYNYNYNTQANYKAALKAYNDFIDVIELCTKTANETAVTQADLNMAKAEVPDLEDAVDEATATWQSALAGLNDGNGPEPTLLDGYDAIKTATANFNASVATRNAAAAELNAKKAALTAAQAAQKAAQDALDATGSPAITTQTQIVENTRDAEVQQAWDDYYEAIDQATATKDATIGNYNVTLNKLYEDEWNAQQKYINAVALYTSNPTTANQTLMNNAQTAYNTAVTTRSKYETDNASLVDKAIAAYNNAKANAQFVRNNAIADAWTKFNKALIDINASGEDRSPEQIALDEAIAATNAAQTAVTKAQEPFDKAVAAIITGNKATLNVLNSAVNAQATGYGCNPVNYITSDYMTWSSKVGNDMSDSAKTIADADAADMTYFNTNAAMKDVVVAASAALYGSAAGGNMVLVAMTEAEMAAYQAANGEAGTGAFGALVAKQTEIAKYEVILNNPELVSDAVAMVQAQIDAINAQKSANDAKVKAAQDAFTPVKNEKAALEKPINDKLAVITPKITAINGVLTAITNALNGQTAATIAYDAEGNPYLKEGYLNEDVIKDYVAALKNSITYYNNEVETTTKDLEKLELLLEQAEGNAELNSELVAALVEIAELELEAAQAQVDNAKANLDAAIEKYGAEKVEL